MAATKTLVTVTQEYTVLISKGMNEKTLTAKRTKVDDNGNKAKAALKNIIPAAKAVGVLGQNVEGTKELKTLKQEIQTLTDSAEIMLINLRMDDDDFLLESMVLTSSQKPKEFHQAPTGNEALDSLVSGFNMFGIAPELAEMMKQAASMGEVDDSESDPYGNPAMRILRSLPFLQPCGNSLTLFFPLQPLRMMGWTIFSPTSTVPLMASMFPGLPSPRCSTPTLVLT